MKTLIANLQAFKRWLHAVVRRMLCKHEWRQLSADRYAVLRGDGSKEGEVTLTLLECPKCGKDWLIPSNRQHSPNEKAHLLRPGTTEP